ncbi:MAG: ABC transporter ATP-binding protein [Caldilineaceae bacterium]|nr:ABC transporter ATP-binding protein [Caldilineaceae bacterium]
MKGRRLEVYRRLIGYLQPHWRQALFAYAAMLLATLMNLAVPQIIKQAIDRGLAQGSATMLYWAAGVIMAIAVARVAVSFVRIYFGEWLTHRVSYDLRNHFYGSLQSLPFAFHDRAQTGDLMSRATSDIGETERFAGVGVLDLFATVLLVVGVSVAMFIEHAWLAAMVMVPLAALVVTAIYFGNTIRPMFRVIQEQMGKLASVMQESMTGIGVVKAFAREEHELEKFDHENLLWFEKRYESMKIWANYWPLFTLILSTAIVLLLWFGGPAAIHGEMTVGSLFAMISYVLMLNAPVSHLGFLVNLAATAAASAARVFEIIDMPNDVVEAPDAVDVEQVRGEVRFENVSFAYSPGRSTLEEINFEAAPGQIVALIGPTGSGKSTITNLIPRFYDPSEGRVLIDGIDVRKMRLRSLRQHIGIVLQAPFLFNATIAENIAYGQPDASAEEIEAAARAAAAHKFITQFPLGYQTMVGERGVTLSGGQKQRIAIARAILRNPRILILDDSTSSVDTETEHIIQQALAVLMQGRTTFIIAQRLLTLKSADMILVLDHGRIVQRGTHEQLLAEPGLYRDIYDLQLRDQEEFVAAQEEPVSRPSSRTTVAVDLRARG